MGKCNTPARLRTVRNIETGELTTQSSNKTKRLLRLGGYVEVPSGARQAPPHSPHGRSSALQWRAIGIGAAMILVVLAVVAWLKLAHVI